MLLDTTPDLEHSNLIDLGVKQLNQNISAIRAEIKKNEKLIKRTEKARNRMKRKSGKPNLFESLIEERLGAINNIIARLKVVVETHEKIKVELMDYEYSFDMQESGGLEWKRFDLSYV